MARARLAAALGSPMPTKQVMPSCQGPRRAGGHHLVGGVPAWARFARRPRWPCRAASRRQCGRARRPTFAGYAACWPGQHRGGRRPRRPASAESLPVAADRVPGHVEVVVPGRVAQRVGGVRRRRALPLRSPRPRRAARWPPAGGQLVHDLLHGDDRPLRAEHRLLLHPGDSPQLDVPGPVGTLRVDDRHVGVQRGYRGQPLAGERAGDRPDSGLAVQAGQALQAGAAVAAQDRERQARRRRPRTGWPCPRGCVPPAASGPGQPFSTASRNRCSEPTPGLPPQEKISLLAQPAPMSWS